MEDRIKELEKKVKYLSILTGIIAMAILIFSAIFVFTDMIKWSAQVEFNEITKEKLLQQDGMLWAEMDDIQELYEELDIKQPSKNNGG